MFILSARRRRVVKLPAGALSPQSRLRRGLCGLSGAQPPSCSVMASSKTRQERPKRLKNAPAASPQPNGDSAAQRPCLTVWRPSTRSGVLAAGGPFGRRRRHGRLSPDRTNGALVHVAVFRAFNPSRITSRMVSQTVGLSRIMSRRVYRCGPAKKAIPVRADSAETRSRSGSERGRKDRIYGNWDERGASDLGSGRTPL